MLSVKFLLCSFINHRLRPLGAVQMVQNMESMGFTVVPFGQGFKDMSPAH